MTGSWRQATCVATRRETSTARSIRFRVDDLGDVLPGQHVDIRLTADDGYQAVRSYSLSATPRGHDPKEAVDPGMRLAADEIEVTVEELPEGEVSPFLVQALEVGDTVDVRGPIGGWFVWRESDPTPVQLIGGGSGVAPLMAILRARAASSSTVPMRLLYSVRSPEAVYFRAELDELATSAGIDVDIVYTREAPGAVTRIPGRIVDADIDEAVEPTAGLFFVCGPTGFVSAVTDLLLARAIDPAIIRTERFGGTAAAPA